MAEHHFIARFWNHRSHDYVGLLFRLVVGVVFLIAAWPKIVAPGDFAWSIAMYRMLPYRYVHLLAIVLPWVELLCGLTLLFGVKTKGSAVVVCGMLVMFIIAITYAIVSKLEMAGCGCFSQEGAKALASHREEMGTSLLYRDIVMLFMTGYVWLFDTGRFGVDGLLRRRKKCDHPSSLLP